MTPADRKSAADGHILIGGTGRAGTTLLVQYFTALGFDTGFTLRRARRRVDPVSRAGLEHPYRKTLAAGRRLPYVAKSPKYGADLFDDLGSGRLRVKHCIVPVRELTAAAQSRRQVSRQSLASGKNVEDKQPGGIVGAPVGARQKRLLAVTFYKLVYTMVYYEVPIHFLKFPQFATGEQDLFDALEPVMTEHGVTRQESSDALAKVLRPEFVSEFRSS